MANTFKNEYYDITASLAEAYAAPTGSGDVAIILTCRITNVDGANDATVTAQVYTDGSNDAHIAYTMTVPADSSIELAGTSKIVLKASDVLKLQASTASDLEAFISVLEIT